MMKKWTDRIAKVWAFLAEAFAVGDGEDFDAWDDWADWDAEEAEML